MAPIRVLQVVPNMHRAGLETLIMNIYRNIDRNAVQFDFLVHYFHAKTGLSRLALSLLVRLQTV